MTGTGLQQKRWLGRDQRYVQPYVDHFFADRPPRTALDVGCGIRMMVDLPGTTLTGLDVSGEALAQCSHLDERVLDSIETWRPPKAFDLVICWNVLEHLRRPQTAMQNLAAAVGDGGLLIIGMPNLWSVKGLATRLIPYRFHLWVLRNIVGKHGAGSGLDRPHKTFFRITPAGVVRAGQKYGLEMNHFELREMDTQQGLPPTARLVFDLAVFLLSAVTLGRARPRASESLILLSKPPLGSS